MLSALEVTRARSPYFLEAPEALGSAFLLAVGNPGLLLSGAPFSCVSAGFVNQGAIVLSSVFSIVLSYGFHALSIDSAMALQSLCLSFLAIVQRWTILLNPYKTLAMCRKIDVGHELPACCGTLASCEKNDSTLATMIAESKKYQTKNRCVKQSKNSNQTAEVLA